MNLTAQRLKEEISMEDVLDKYGFERKKSGFINCPFHTGDRTASLKVYPDNRGWHCFGCGAGGSVIDFVMHLFGLSFGQALIRLDNDFCVGAATQQDDLLESRKIARERIEAHKREKLREKQYGELWDRFASIDRTLSKHPPDSDSSAAIAGALMGILERLWWEIAWMDHQRDQGVKG